MPRFFSHVMWKYVDSVVGLSVFFLLLVMLCFAPDQSTDAPTHEPTIYYVDGERDGEDFVYVFGRKIEGVGMYAVYLEGVEGGKEVEIESAVEGIDRVVTRGGGEWEYVGEYALGVGGERLRIKNGGREELRIKVVRMREIGQELDDKRLEKAQYGRISSLARNNSPLDGRIFSRGHQTKQFSREATPGAFGGDNGEGDALLSSVGNHILILNDASLGFYRSSSWRSVRHATFGGFFIPEWERMEMNSMRLLAPADGKVKLIITYNDDFLPIDPLDIEWRVRDVQGKTIDSGDFNSGAFVTQVPFEDFLELDTHRHGNFFYVGVYSKINGQLLSQHTVEVIDSVGGCCGQGVCDRRGGNVVVEQRNGEVEVWIGLGSNNFGKTPAAFVFSYKEDTDYTSGWILGSLALTGDVEEVVADLYENQYGFFRQVKTETDLVDVIPLDDHEFEFRFYDKENATVVPFVPGDPNGGRAVFSFPFGAGGWIFSTYYVWYLNTTHSVFPYIHFVTWSDNLVADLATFSNYELLSYNSEGDYWESCVEVGFNSIESKYEIIYFSVTDDDPINPGLADSFYWLDDARGVVDGCDSHTVPPVPNYSPYRRLWAGVPNLKIFGGMYAPIGEPYKIVRVKKGEDQPIEITEIVDGQEEVTKVEFQKIVSQFRVIEWATIKKEGSDGLGGFSKETIQHVKIDTPNTGEMEITTEVREGGLLVSSDRKIFTQYAWGNVLTEHAIPDGNGGECITQWTYQDSLSDGAGRMATLHQLHDGYQEIYVYNSDHVLEETLMNYENTTGARSIQQVDNNGVEITEERINGIVVRVEYEEWLDNYTRIHERATHTGAIYGDSDNLRTQTVYYDNTTDFEFELKSVERPDGTMDLYTYSEAADLLTTIHSSGVPNASKNAIIDGLEVVTIKDKGGHQLRQTSTDIVSGIVIRDELTLEQDTYGRPTKIQNLIDGSITEQTYGCCGVDYEVARDGQRTTYSYDSQEKLTHTHLLEQDIIYETIYVGTQELRKRIGSNGSEIVQSFKKFKENGELEYEMDALGGTTYYDTEYPGQGRKETTELPVLPGDAEGGMLERTYAADGKLLEERGTGVNNTKYEYGAHTVGGGGEYINTIKLDAEDNETEWEKVYRNAAGQIIQRELPTTDGAGSVFYTYAYYPGTGQLKSVTDPDGVTTLYAYNAKGERYQTALDLNDNGVIDTTVDRITERETGYRRDLGLNLRYTDKYTYPTDGSSNRLLLSTNYQALSMDASATIDVNGNLSYNLTTYLYDGVNASTRGDRTVKMVRADQSYQIQTYDAGRLVKRVQYDRNGGQIGRKNYAYDAHGRLQYEQDARTGLLTRSYNDRDERETETTSAGQLTTWFYTLRPGLYYKQELPGHTLGDPREINRDYTKKGEIAREDGYLTYTRDMTYDEQGRLETQTTYRDELGGLNAVTTWIYNDHRGYIDKKEYDDGKGPSYTYSPGGRVEMREWARGLVTEYLYNFAGELTDKKYWTDISMRVADPDTENIHYAYTRWGALASVDDEVGHRDFSYRASDLQLDQEIITPQGVYDNPMDKRIERVYEDGSGDTVIGRYSGVRYLQHSTSFLFNQILYGYDEAGRVETVSDNTTSFSGGTVSGTTYTYTYVPNSNLVGGVSDDVFRLTYSYESDRDVVKTAKNERKSGVGTWAVVSEYNYRNNELDQKRDVVKSGEGFAGWDGDHIESYEYNENGELIEMKRYEGTDPENPGMEIGSYEYEYDKVGNRESETREGVEITYLTNELNQYTDIGTEQRIYDSDGNLLSYRDEGGVDWELSWDGENRLIQAEEAGVLQVGAFRFIYGYDYMGRGVRQRTESYDGSEWELSYTHFYGYDGWRALGQVRVTGVSSAFNDLMYTWGLDVSGSIGGAGGVGGKLAMRSRYTGSGGRYNLCYDGRGNVVDIVRREASDVTGERIVHYEYDSYGRILVEENVHMNYGDIAGLNKFQYSTKASYSGGVGLILYYYGHRYYDPNSGRWLTRDPMYDVIGRHPELVERLPNIYAFVGNNPISRIDPLGLYTLGDAEKSLGDVITDIIDGDYVTYPWTDEEIFDEWLRLEKNDMKWLEGIPACPDRICLDGKGKPKNCTNGKWGALKNDALVKKFHPLADYCMRSKKQANGSAQQCCYKESADGKWLDLIKSGESAGTPDRRAAAGVAGSAANFLMDTGHVGHDVTPFNLAKKLNRVDDYLSVRPISQGGGKCYGN